MGFVETAFIAGLLGLVFGCWLIRDTNRFAAHLQIAETLMAAGIPEAAAMVSSGCDHWDRPWYLRILRRYPALQSVAGTAIAGEPTDRGPW